MGPGINCQQLAFHTSHRSGGVPVFVLTSESVDMFTLCVSPSLSMKITLWNQKMAAAQKHVLRVYVARDTALKLTLLDRPKSVEELKEIMQERFKPRLDGDFSLHYEDPDFNGDLCLLVDIQELPENLPHLLTQTYSRMHLRYSARRVGLITLLFLVLVMKWSIY